MSLSLDNTVIFLFVFADHFQLGVTECNYGFPLSPRLKFKYDIFNKLIMMFAEFHLLFQSFITVMYIFQITG